MSIRLTVIWYYDLLWEGISVVKSNGTSRIKKTSHCKVFDTVKGNKGVTKGRFSRFMSNCYLKQRNRPSVYPKPKPGAELYMWKMGKKHYWLYLMAKSS
jgi:hypothetical protein